MTRSNTPWGAVRKLPSGRYQIRFHVDGERRNGETTYRTRREADEALAAIRTDLARSTWTDPTEAKATLLADYATLWLDNRPDLAPRTIELYEGLQRLHIFPTLGQRTLTEITPTMVRTWRAGLIKAGKPGRSTIAKSYRLLHAMMNTAVDEDGLLAVNPCRIKGAGVEHPAERPTLTVDQFLAAAAEVPDRYRAMVLLATVASLRLGEVRALRRHRIDLDVGDVHVVEQVQDLRDGTRVFGPPKSTELTKGDRPAGIRTVAIPAALVQELEVHLARHAAPGPRGLLFATRNGDPIRASTIFQAWNGARRRIGLDHVHFHDLRHTGCTWAAQDGASTKELMDRLGHSTPRAALIYQHATRDRDRAIAAGLGERLRQASSGNVWAFTEAA